MEKAACARNKSWAFEAAARARGGNVFSKIYKNGIMLWKNGNLLSIRKQKGQTHA